jgi:CBS domain-containing protein
MPIALSGDPPRFKELTMTQVADLMTRAVKTMQSSSTLVEAAQAMADLNVGALPVCVGRKVIGMVTDRDIVLRGVTQGRAVDQLCMLDVMTADPMHVHEDDDLEKVSALMRNAQVRRVPVMDRQEQLVGILSLGDLATRGSLDEAGDALAAISEPAGADHAPSGGPSGHEVRR